VHKEADWRVDHVVERNSVETTCDGLLFFKRFRVKPSRDAGLDLWYVGPARQIIVAVGVKIVVGCWIDAGETASPYWVYAPATLAGRGFPPQAHYNRAPVNSHCVYVCAEAFQNVCCHFTPGFHHWDVPWNQDHNRLTGVSALRQQSLGGIDIAWSLQDFAAFLIVERRTRRKEAG
jgi:hypothetical protein